MISRILIPNAEGGRWRWQHEKGSPHFLHVGDLKSLLWDKFLFFFFCDYILRSTIQIQERRPISFETKMMRKLNQQIHDESGRNE